MDKDKEEKKETKSSLPQPIAENQPANIDPAQAASYSYVDLQVKTLKENIQRGDSISFFIIVILTVGFITLCVSVASMVMQNWTLNSTQAQMSNNLKQQNELLQSTIRNQQSIIDTLKSSKP